MKKIFRIYFILCLIFLFIVPINMYFYPEEVSRFIGFRFYVVLSESMEPTIPTYSLVFSKVINEDEKINPDTIVTFKANKDGEDILLTHYYRDTVEKNGETYYRTQPEGIKDQYDPYNTTRSDIIGQYIFHIPYIGKTFVFLQSGFGFLLYAEWLIIFLVNKTIKLLWKEKEEKRLKAYFNDTNFIEARSVYYFSRSHISEMIAEYAFPKISIRRIVDHKDWTGTWGYLKAMYYARKKTCIEIEYDKPTDDVIYVCFPLWHRTFPPAVRSFINQVGRDKVVAIVSSKSTTLKDREGFIKVIDIVGKQDKKSIKKLFKQIKGSTDV